MHTYTYMYVVTNMFHLTFCQDAEVSGSGSCGNTLILWTFGRVRQEEHTYKGYDQHMGPKHGLAHV